MKTLFIQEKVSGWIREVLEEEGLPHLKEACSMRNTSLCFTSIPGVYDNAPGILMSVGLSRWVEPGTYSSARLTIIQQLDGGVHKEAVRKALGLLEAKLEILNDASEMVWKQALG